MDRLTQAKLELYATHKANKVLLRHIKGNIAKKLELIHIQKELYFMLDDFKSYRETLKEKIELIDDYYIKLKRKNSTL